MKTPTDPRHLLREKIVKILFSYSFNSKKPHPKDLVPILSNLKTIDRHIRQAAPEWPIEQVNRLDLAVLRLAVYELVITPNQPPSVIIDEAVEIAKKYGSEKSPGFVNGVLGTVLKKQSARKESK